MPPSLVLPESAAEALDFLYEHRVSTPQIREILAFRRGHLVAEHGIGDDKARDRFACDVIHRPSTAPFRAHEFPFRSTTLERWSDPCAWEDE